MKRNKKIIKKFTYANFDNLEWVFDAARYSKKQALKIVQKEEGFTPEEMNDLEVREDWCKYCDIAPEWAEEKVADISSKTTKESKVHSKCGAYHD